MKKTIVFSLMFFISSAPTWADENLRFYSRGDTIEYYKKLVKLHRTHPEVQLKIEDFNHTFSPIPAAPPPGVEFFTRCSGKYAKGDCQLDTYYSWGPLNKMENIRNETVVLNYPYPHDQEWQGLNQNIGVYLSSTALATYCYGTTPIRFKFKTTGSGPRISNMFTRGIWGSKWPEWVLPYKGSLKNILESVSYGQPEHFDEMIIEMQRRLDPQKPWKDVPMYGKSLSMEKFTDKLKGQVILGCFDNEGFRASESRLTENLVQFLEAVLAGEGWVHTAEIDMSDGEHFKTGRATFFNPE